MNIKRLIGLMLISLLVIPVVYGTNGDNLIGVGPVSRSLGGTGIAAPQESVTAIFQNPAALGACPCGQKSESVFGGTLFDPSVHAKITTPWGVYEGDSKHEPFVIPAVGVTMALDEKTRFGVGAYGVSGMGVDYRGNQWDMDGNAANGFEGDIYTKIEIMKFAGMLSYQVLEDLAIGASANMAYNNLDLGAGGTHDYSFGGQLGVLYSLGMVDLGASYTLPQESSHARVANFDSSMGSTSLDTLKLESPAMYGVGIAVKPTEKWMLELDTKYLDWENATGYKDFDWESQWAFAVGAQYMPVSKVALRIGYNYAKNPVKEHNGWNPAGMSEIQGTAVPTMGFEMMRVVGLPAIVENHLTLGIGYLIAEDVMLNLGYIHAFEDSITETSAGDAFTLESTMSQNSYSLSIAWAF